jgi:adenosylhomocysteine nucleosidase
MIHLVVAHSAEARPLVARYDLRGENGHGAFPVYRGDSLVVAVGGPGKTAAASAAGYLFAAGGGGRDAAWVNLGMAGHAELEIGRGLLAHKVVDEGSGACWYPPLTIETACPSATVHTVEGLEEDYEGDRLYDTEAAGFFAAASRFATCELVHAFKIVIDNHGATLGESFTPEVMEDLVASKLGVLDGLFDDLRCASELVRRRREQGRGMAAEGER